MQIRFDCPVDDCVAIIELEPFEEAGATIRCPRCSKEHPITITDAMRHDQTVDQCAVCGNRELFNRKDFPQRVGLAVVVIAGLASLYHLGSNFPLAYAILGAAMVFDFVLYLMIGKVTTCYACRAQYRKLKLNPAHDNFDLPTSEKY